MRHESKGSTAAEFWEKKPATVAGMLLEEPEGLDHAERVQIIAQLPPMEGMEILELGAGIGRYTAHLAHSARHVTAVDFVEKFLDQNRIAIAPFGNVTYCCTDVMNLDFEPDSFDFVFMSWLLMYLNDRQMMLLRDRIVRWVRVGGTVFFRESCFVGSSGRPLSKGNPATYRPDSDWSMT